MMISYIRFITILSVLFSHQVTAQSKEFVKVHRQNRDTLWVNPEKAIELEKKLLSDITLGDSALVRGYQFLGLAYSHIAEWDSCLRYNRKAIKIGEELGLEKLVAYTKCNMGILYAQRKDTLSANIWLEEVKDFFLEKGSAKAKTAFFTTLAVTVPSDSVQLIRSYANSALKYAYQEMDSGRVASTHAMLGNHFVRYNLDSAYYHSTMAESFIDMSSSYGYISAKIAIASVLLADSKPKEALERLRKAQEVSEKYGLFDTDIYRVMSETFIDLAEYDSAMVYLERHHKKKLETSFNDANYRQANLQLRKLQDEIGVISKENRSTILRVSELQAEKKLAEHQLSSSRKLFIVVSIFLVCAIIILVFVNRQSLKLKKKQEELERITYSQQLLLKDIEQKNKEFFTVNETLKLTKDQLVHSEKMNAIGTLTAGIAHELNNPLNFISGGVTYLSNHFLEKSETIDKDQTKRVIDMMKEGTKRASFIVKSLRSFTEKDTSNALEDVLVVDLVERASSLLKQEFKQKNINYVFSKPTAKIEARCNPEAIVLAIVNLLINATQTIENDGEISVSTDVVNNRKFVEIKVKDGGGGIESEDLKRIFDPFFTTKSPDSNSGLGLFMVHKLVTGSGGEVTVNSEMGKGTEFKIKLANSNIK